MRISDWSSDVCSSDLELEGMIVSGELSGGDRLNETVLAERFGVSRGPVREACRGLERSGLIRFVANRGVFVREMNVKEALELFDVRARSEERRVGKEGVSTCRSRGSPDH